MSIATFFKSLLPFASAAGTDIASAAAAIQAKADADIAALKAKQAKNATVQTIAQKQANFEALVADYRVKLAAEKAAAESAPVPAVPAAPAPVKPTTASGPLSAAS
jgi:ribulose kinase